MSYMIIVTINKKIVKIFQTSTNELERDITTQLMDIKANLVAKKVEVSSLLSHIIMSSEFGDFVYGKERDRVMISWEMI